MSQRDLKKFFVIYYIFVAVLGIAGYGTLFGGFGAGSASGSDQSGTTLQVGSAPAIDFETVKEIENSLKERMVLEVGSGTKKDKVLDYSNFITDDSAWFKGIRNKLFGKELVLEYEITYEYEVNLQGVSANKAGDNGISISIPSCELTFHKSNLEVKGETTGWLQKKLSAEEFEKMQKGCDDHYKNQIQSEWLSGGQSRANEQAKDKIRNLVQSMLSAAGKKDIKIDIIVN